MTSNVCTEYVQESHGGTSAQLPTAGTASAPLRCPGQQACGTTVEPSTLTSATYTGVGRHQTFTADAADLALPTQSVPVCLDSEGSDRSCLAGRDMCTQTPARPPKRKLPLSTYKRGLDMHSMHTPPQARGGRTPQRGLEEDWCKRAAEIRMPTAQHGTAPRTLGISNLMPTCSAERSRPAFDRVMVGCGHMKRQRTPLAEASMWPLSTYAASTPFSALESPSKCMDKIVHPSTLEDVSKLTWLQLAEIPCRYILAWQSRHCGTLCTRIWRIISSTVGTRPAINGSTSLVGVVYSEWLACI